MAAPVNNKSSCWDTPEVYKHHEQHKVCISRPKYREGRKDRAVKVYTINLESRYVMVQGVPAIGVMAELVALCALYGAVEEYRPLDEYPAEEFTEVYLVKFQKLTSARAAKRRMDGTSFYGGILHVCYVPEHETAQDTRLKLQDRRRYVNRTAQMIAREKSELTEGDKEATSSDNKTTPSQRTPSQGTPSQRTPSQGTPSQGTPSQRTPSQRTPSQRTPSAAAHDQSGARQTSSSGRFADRSSVHNNNNAAGESRTSSSHYYAAAGGFPLLPLPPREEHRYGHNATTHPHRTAVPTEDNMGTLHNVVIADQKQQPTQSRVGRSTPAIGDHRGPTPEKAPAAPASLVPRFVPRTTHLENRKRKMEEEAKKSHLSCGVTGGDGEEGPLVGSPGGDSEEGPLVGPSLPGPPRMDMEDVSLNATVGRIRSTLQQVASVPDIKPVPKKMKPRRRI